MKVSHISIRTQNLTRMADFLINALDLKMGYRPDYVVPGLWLYSDGQALFHLCEADSTTQKSYTELVKNIAIEGDDYQALKFRLESYSFTFTEEYSPITGLHRILIPGPENLSLDMAFPRKISLSTDNEILDIENKLSDLGDTYIELPSNTPCSFK